MCLSREADKKFNGLRLVQNVVHEFRENERADDRAMIRFTSGPSYSFSSPQTPILSTHHHQLSYTCWEVSHMPISTLDGRLGLEHIEYRESSGESYSINLNNHTVLANDRTTST